MNYVKYSLPPTVLVSARYLNLKILFNSGTLRSSRHKSSKLSNQEQTTKQLRRGICEVDRNWTRAAYEIFFALHPVIIFYADSTVWRLGQNDKEFKLSKEGIPKIKLELLYVVSSGRLMLKTYSLESHSPPKQICYC